MPMVRGIIIAILGASLVQAAEPYRLVLTDVEKNIYKETAQIAGSEVTPDCPVAWSVSKSVLHGGKQEGVEIIEVNNGKLRFTVVPTRGMSIYEVAMESMRLGWDSPVKGLVHPKYVNLQTRRGLGWLKGFNEWMVRCGLEFFGAPGTDEFTDNTGAKATMDLTLHGKICNTPASVVEITVQREAPYRIAVRGRVEETALHGPKLEMWTQVSTTPGAAAFQISDTVTNRSAVEQEFGILYHSNYGPPLMEEGAKLFGPVQQVTPINEHAAKDVASYDVYSSGSSAPSTTGLTDRAAQAGFAEQVYCLRLWADANDRTQVVLRNAAGTKAVSMAYSVKELPFFTLWKNPAENNCQLSIADCRLETCLPTGKIENRKSKIGNRLLGPHQSRSFTIDFALYANKEQVFAAGQEVARIWAGRPTQTDTSPLATEVEAARKTTLSDIIKAARTWRPGYQTWYGKPAPDFTLADLSGKEHKLSDYKGKNVLVIFWATWCGPCLREIPDLIELRKTVGEDDLAMLAISDESPALVKRFVDQAKMNYTILLDPGTVPAPYNTISAIPSSFFIDRQGKIKLATTGLVSLREIKAILDAE